MRIHIPNTGTVLAAFLLAAVTSTRAADNLQAEAQQTIHTFVQKDPTLENFIET
jgi:hypothetical protein